MKKYWLLWAGVTLLLFVIVMALYQWLSFNKTETINKEQAQQLVIDNYGGNILGNELVNNQFIIDIKKDTGNFQVILDKSGKILSVKKTGDQKEPSVDEKLLSEKEIRTIISSKVPGTIQSIEQIMGGETPLFQVVVTDGERQQSVKIDGFSGEIVEQAEVNMGSKRITEQEAIQLALEQVSGRVDDVEQEIIEGVVYYYVEVETTDGKEAIVEIDSITGEIRSVTWDD